MHSLKSRLSIIAFAFVFALRLAAQPAAIAEKSESLSEFKARLKATATQPRFNAAMFGIKVESLDSGKVIFEQDADKLLKPASNGKMYTGALALDRLGPDFKIRTSFYASSAPDQTGTINGDLIVFGRGDPSLSHRFNNGDYNKPIEQLAGALIKAGVKKIKGNLIGDESFFRGSRFGTGWSVDDLQYYYGAEVSALTFQENVVDLYFRPGANPGDPLKISTKPETTYLNFINRAKTVEKGGPRSIELYRAHDSNDVYIWGSLPVGSAAYADAVAVYDAPLWFVTTLRDALEKRGVKVEGDLKTANALDRETQPLDFSKLKEIAFIESRPLSEIVKNMMKPSQNLYADLLLLQVGESTRTPQSNRRDSESLGLAELGRFLEEIGISKGDVLMEEGSGLSRGCLLKPAATVALLKHMSNHKHGEIYRDSLPIAGVDGTLRTRLKGTSAENNLRAKTGSLRYVRSLSGYVTTRVGEHLAFSLMINNYTGSDSTQQLDKIAEMLASLSVFSTSSK